jgi:Protein of unknown function (DUF3455)
MLTLALVVGPGLPVAAEAARTALEIPPPLQVPPGYRLVWEVRAAGVQIYDCAPSPTDPRASVWTFREPAALLFDHGRHVAGIHYRGPTWTSWDGSTVVGAVPPVAMVPAPRPRAIPWLLLKAASAQGDGVLGDVEYIQRLDTAGGVAPPGSCDPDEDATISVPYRALYRFYAAAA